MKTNKFNEYSYEDLRDKAWARDATQIDVDTLGAWFEEYGDCYWNGECYNVDGMNLFPVYKHDEERDQDEITGYVFK